MYVLLVVICFYCCFPEPGGWSVPLHAQYPEYPSRGFRTVHPGDVQPSGSWRMEDYAGGRYDSGERPDTGYTVPLTPSSSIWFPCMKYLACLASLLVVSFICVLFVLERKVFKNRLLDFCSEMYFSIYAPAKALVAWFYFRYWPV